LNLSPSVFYVGTQAEVAHHAAPLAEHLPLQIVSAEDVAMRAQPGDMAIFFNEFFPRFRNAIRLLQTRGCATLYAIDGILEWRSSWEDSQPETIPGVMRPILSHKIACIGKSQARILESWGNLGKCEVVGVPRFDRLLGRQPRTRTEQEPFKVLILTAKCPGFSPEQIERTKHSLADLKAWFDSHTSWQGTPIQPIWRITAGLDKAIGVTNALQDTTGKDLASILERVDAVITTASTTMLEGMLQGVPVALLDYHNCPHYVPAAWVISSREHLDRVVPELLHPPEPKLLHEQFLLHDSLECRTLATPRLLELVQQMLRISDECLERGEPLAFPNRILPGHGDDPHLPEEGFDLQRLYAQHPVFGNLDRASLQVQLSESMAELQKAKREYSELLDNKQQLGTHLGNQVQSLESSASYRLGRLLTWPVRSIARLVR